jgi:hypothetical protein
MPYLVVISLVIFIPDRLLLTKIGIDNFLSAHSLVNKIYTPLYQFQVVSDDVCIEIALSRPQK